MMDKVIEFFEDDDADLREILLSLSDEDQVEFLYCLQEFAENLRRQYGSTPELDAMLAGLPRVIEAAEKVVEKKEALELSRDDRERTQFDLIEYIKTGVQDEELAAYREVQELVRRNPDLSKADEALRTIEENIQRLESEKANKEIRQQIIEEYKTKFELDEDNILEIYEEFIERARPFSTPDETIRDYKHYAGLLHNARENISKDEQPEFDRFIEQVEKQIEEMETERNRQLTLYVDKIIALDEFKKSIIELEKKKFRLNPKDISLN